MKELKYTRKLSVLIEQINYKINKEYANNIYKLVKKIAIGENLDFDMLKNKYLKSKSKETQEDNQNDNQNDTPETPDTQEISNINEIVESTDTLSPTSSEHQSEIILDKIIINDINYYYENKENGHIYDSKSKIVGEFKNNVHYLFEN